MPVEAAVALDDKATHTIMELNADTKQEFDFSKVEDRAAAESRFGALTNNGYTAAEQTSSGRFLMPKFDSTVKEALFLSKDRLALEAYRAALGIKPESPNVSVASAKQ